jgi:hypothetical protein
VASTGDPRSPAGAGCAGREGRGVVRSRGAADGSGWLHCGDSGSGGLRRSGGRRDEAGGSGGLHEEGSAGLHDEGGSIGPQGGDWG